MRLRTTMLKFVTYMMDRKHTMVEHLRIMTASVCDLKLTDNNLIEGQSILVTTQSILIPKKR